MSPFIEKLLPAPHFTESRDRLLLSGECCMAQAGWLFVLRMLRERRSEKKVYTPVGVCNGQKWFGVWISECAYIQQSLYTASWRLRLKCPLFWSATELKIRHFPICFIDYFQSNGNLIGNIVHYCSWKDYEVGGKDHVILLDSRLCWHVSLVHCWLQSCLDITSQTVWRQISNDRKSEPLKIWKIACFLFAVVVVLLFICHKRRVCPV